MKIGTIVTWRGKNPFTKTTYLGIVVGGSDDDFPGQDRRIVVQDAISLTEVESKGGDLEYKSIRVEELTSHKGPVG